jgi:hypothetical protein
MLMSSEDRKDFLFRTGTFFVLVGFGMMILFGASMCAPTEETLSTESDLLSNGMFFIAGLLSFAFGMYLKRISAPPPKPSSGRFGGMRRILGSMKKNKK